MAKRWTIQNVATYNNKVRSPGQWLGARETTEELSFPLSCSLFVTDLCLGIAH